MKLEQIRDALSADITVLKKLQLALEQLTTYLDAERGCMMITRDGHELLLFAGDEDLNLRFPFSRSLVSETMVGNTGLVSFQEGGIGSDTGSSLALHGVRAAICVPILSSTGEDFGVVYFDTRLENKIFSEPHLNDVGYVTRSIGLLLESL